jgi:hypothetical protein
MPGSACHKPFQFVLHQCSQHAAPAAANKLSGPEFCRHRDPNPKLGGLMACVVSAGRVCFPKLQIKTLNMKQCNPRNIRNKSAGATKLELGDIGGEQDGLFIEPATINRANGEELVLFLRDKEPTIKRLAESDALQYEIRVEFKSNNFGSVAFILFWVFDGSDKAKKPIASVIKFFDPRDEEEISFWNRFADAEGWHLFLMAGNKRHKLMHLGKCHGLDDRLDSIVERSEGVAAGDPIKVRKKLLQEFPVEELIKYADLDAQAKQMQRSLRPPGKTGRNSGLMSQELETIKQLNLRYPNFAEMLKFSVKRKLPTCKCKIWANLGHDWASYGYSNGLLHVAAAICFVLREEAQGEGQFEVCELKVRRQDGVAYIRVEDWDLIYIEPLTPAEIKKVRLEHRAKRGKSAQKTSLKTAGKHVKSKDPFETGLALYPYMPGGQWDN